LSGAGQGSHLDPQEFTLVSLRHWPPQACVPAAHMFMHVCVVGIHTPAQSS
jgi:hypothetical protein